MACLYKASTQGSARKQQISILWVLNLNDSHLVFIKDLYFFSCQVDGKAKKLQKNDVPKAKKRKVIDEEITSESERYVLCHPFGVTDNDTVVPQFCFCKNDAV